MSARRVARSLPSRRNLSAIPGLPVPVARSASNLHLPTLPASRLSEPCGEEADADQSQDEPGGHPHDQAGDLLIVERFDAVACDVTA